MSRPTPRKPERPIFWIIAGPNGSGKSSFYNRTDIDGWGGSVWIINPDLLTQQIVEREHSDLVEANGTALDRVMTWLTASIDAYQTVGVETVLSSDKYRAVVRSAKARGFDIRMIYVVLDTADRQLERIRIRVADGGHDVPADKVVSRRQGSFEQLAWFVQHVDTVYLFDNSVGEPDLIGVKVRGPLWMRRDWPKDLRQVLAQAGVDLRTTD